MEKKLLGKAGVNVTGRDFFCSINREFYVLLPEEFRVMKNPETGRVSLVIPRELRNESVKVGYQEPPGG